MKLAHARALVIAVPSWCYAVLWLWPRAAQADALATEFWQYDWLSLVYAAGMGLLGGFLALIYALATDRRVVLEVLKEGGRNALVSPIAGAGAYLFLKACAALGWFTVPTDPKFFCIVTAGWAGTAAIEWAGVTLKKAMGELGDWLVARGKQ